MSYNRKVINATISKYQNTFFRSKLESSVAEILDNLKIKYEYEQKKFILLPSFKFQESTVRQITYTPDFIIDDYIIECKGFPTDSWKIKRKLFMNILNNEYPNFRYFEIHSVKELLNIIDMDDRFLTWNILVKDNKDNLIGEFNSISEAIEVLNIKGSKSNIQSCLLGKRHSTLGYKWSRVERVFVPEEGEEWRDVIGFEGLYYVSNLGRVASAQFHNKTNFKLMAQCTVKGYKFVKLRDWKNKVEGSYPVHRLVASAFIENPENKEQVDHIDTDPSNNNLSNLRWVTVLENQRNPITNNRLKSNMIDMNKQGIGPKASAEKKRIAILYTDSEGNTHSYNSICEASRCTGECVSSISRWCSKNIKGWRYDSIREDIESDTCPSREG
jgi:hypothetical protein